MKPTTLSVIIADDNKFFCEALRDKLNTYEELEVKNIFTTIDDLIKYTQNYNFDILILDVNFNGVSSLEYINEIRTHKNSFKIISLTTLNNNYIKSEAIKKGIDFFVSKDSDLSVFKDKILECYNANKPDFINKTSKIKIGNLTFTNRKLEILQALYKHSDKKEKALSDILSISESALKSHKRELFEITNTNSTPDLIKFGIQNGLIIA
ncbi:hypothetical protein WH52_09710 [Tenacibaculum holothuriorum]|uniref:Response regulatory domain-containing protein n=1 Tax=Tenacibaculum holothuriorum TaxID=1635173 RepID=A0A1Y2PD23_9FLAO|nr:response regulator transcription factor [Tenacibaculum holothuriorum]OSY87697.1 hypothetical protein WH52_09710 [Tenacibaculum holothuriorum]